MRLLPGGPVKKDGKTMRKSTAVTAVICTFIFVMPAGAEQMPSARQMSRAITEACSDSAQITLHGEPRYLDLEELKNEHPALGSTVERYQFCWAVEASCGLTDADDSASVTVLSMKTPLDAFGPFSVQRTPDASSMPLPTSAYWLSRQLHVWRGEYYLRASTPVDDSAAQQRVVELVTKIMNAIPVPPSLPGLLRILPWEARQLGQPQYQRHHVLEVELLQNGITVEYLEGQTEEEKTKCTFVVMRYNTRQRAGKAYDALLSALATNPSTAETVEQMGERTTRFHSAQHGECIAMLEKRFVSVVLNYHDPEFAEELLRAAGTNIRTYLLLEDC